MLSGDVGRKNWHSWCALAWQSRTTVPFDRIRHVLHDQYLTKAVAPFLAVVALIDPLDAKPPPGGSACPQNVTKLKRPCRNEGFSFEPRGAKLQLDSGRSWPSTNWRDNWLLALGCWRLVSGLAYRSQRRGALADVPTGGQTADRSAP